MTGDLVSEHQEVWPAHLVLQDDSSGNGIVGRWEGLARTWVRKGEEENWVAADRRTRKKEAGEGGMENPEGHQDHQEPH